MEKPHLGRLMQKIVGKAKPAAERLTFAIEQNTPASNSPNSQQNADAQGDSTMSWNGFNNVDDQSGFDVTPKGTLAKVRMTIKPGGHDDVSQGWTGGWATQSLTTGVVYLSCGFVVLEGQYARRKIWSLIGFYSAKGPDWASIGRAFIKDVLNSSRGASNKDNSPAVQNARRINGLGDLDGIEFAARIDIEKDQNGEDKKSSN